VNLAIHDSDVEHVLSVTSICKLFTVPFQCSYAKINIIYFYININISNNNNIKKMCVLIAHGNRL